MGSNSMFVLIIFFEYDRGHAVSIARAAAIFHQAMVILSSIGADELALVGVTTTIELGEHVIGSKAADDATQLGGDWNRAAPIACRAFDVRTRVRLIGELVCTAGDIVGDGTAVEDAIQVGSLAILIDLAMFQLLIPSTFGTFRRTLAVGTFKFVDFSGNVKWVLWCQAKRRLHLPPSRIVGGLIVAVNIPMRTIIAIIHRLVCVPRASTIAEGGVGVRRIGTVDSFALYHTR